MTFQFSIICMLSQEINLCKINVNIESFCNVCIIWHGYILLLTFYTNFLTIENIDFYWLLYSLCQNSSKFLWAFQNPWLALPCASLLSGVICRKSSRVLHNKSQTVNSDRVLCELSTQETNSIMENYKTHTRLQSLFAPCVLGPFQHSETAV